MLQVKEEDRISWNELFEHPVICPREEKIETSNDSLIQSVRETENYMKSNKVASKTSSVSGETEFSKPEYPEKPSDTIPEEDYNKDVKIQDEKLSEILKVDEIDELMRFKRNISVFLNVQCNSFFTQAGDALKDCLFYIGLFILLRRQISLHKELRS